MVGRSNVSACHISSWLMAVLGMKLAPTSQGCLAYQALAFSSGQGVAAKDEVVRRESMVMESARRMGWVIGEVYFRIPLSLLVSERMITFMPNAPRKTKPARAKSRKSEHWQRL